MKLAGNEKIDTYMVGFWYDVWFLYRRLTHPALERQRRSAGYGYVGPWRSFFHGLRRDCIEQAGDHNWRAVRNYFNGWLAEHPDGRSSAGRGWTRRAALRRLERIRSQP